MVSKMIKGFSYLIDSDNIEDACRKLILHFFKDEIPEKLLAFMKFQQIVEEVLYCEIVQVNGRVIFISEDDLGKASLL